MGLQRGRLQTIGKTLQTAAATFRFSFQSPHCLQPSFMIIVTINPSDSETLCMALALLLSDIILLSGPDIRVKIKDGRPYVVLHHPLDDSR